ncbi:MAG: hypothetical protein KR126chlam6_01217 [Candidatus Anoxychlamydiales bacterium]|nr:hypothetical protein [Candidatus Anoxychlamydiales bacterium]
MRKIFVLVSLLLSTASFALERAPWFGDVYEFHLLSKYRYSFYSKVNAALIQLDSTSNDHLVHFNISFAPSLQWSIDSDLELIETPRQKFGFRSVAFQTRYLFKDDILGDPLSVSVGGNFRIVSSESLKDVSTMYHSNADFEFNLAFGKEFSRFDYWRARFWLYGAIGIANEGSPWLRAHFSLEGNVNDKRKWAIFADAMHGYGRKEFVDIFNFDGYGRIRERNIDLGFKYGYRLRVWGTLSFEYKRRVLAKRCPESVNLFSVSYLVPFSF